MKFDALEYIDILRKAGLENTQAEAHVKILSKVHDEIETGRSPKM